MIVNRLQPAFFASIVLVTAGLAGVVAGSDKDDELLAGAAARIEQCRKADATITVVDGSGKPIRGATVEVRQTRHAFLFGSNIFSWGRLPDDAREQAYRRRFTELLNYATLGFYWPMYEPRRGEPAHARTQQVAQWCKEQGILTKGHPLAWNFADPRWLPADPDEILHLQLARIDDCVKRFHGLIDRWDVMNELTHYDRDEFLRTSPKLTALWKKVGPIELTRQCFERARRANPEAVLLINDYRTDPAYAKVIEQLVDSRGKRLYDVIGIQSHMHGGVWSNTQVWEVCERFARFGVPLHFTEATILSGEQTFDKAQGSPWPSTPEGEAFQAREVARFYTMLFSHPAVSGITWWDFADFQAWKGAPAGLLRADMTPKPAYEELKRLVRGRWLTQVRVTSDDNGTARFRGFLGDYRLTVDVGGKTAILETTTLRKEQPNRWTVKVE